MIVYLCETCGASFPPRDRPPSCCPICEDERQFVRPTGQRWTTREELRLDHRNAWGRLEKHLFEIVTVPAFAIGQRALLVQTPSGNVLWDCVALLDDATVGLIEALGGLSAIAVSHPHYYATCVDWAHEFDCELHLHAADREWLFRSDPRVTFWQGDTLPLNKDMFLHRLGGHFPGATILHWSSGADGKGAILTGDFPQVTSGADRVSFMWSYPNYMPLSAAEVERVSARLLAMDFARIYGAFHDRNVFDEGRAIVARSSERYITLLRGA